MNTTDLESTDLSPMPIDDQSLDVVPHESAVTPEPSEAVAPKTNDAAEARQSAEPASKPYSAPASAPSVAPQPVYTPQPTTTPATNPEPEKAPE
jgi:hypothetical protein